MPVLAGLKPEVVEEVEDILSRYRKRAEELVEPWANRSKQPEDHIAPPADETAPVLVADESGFNQEWS